MTYTCQKRKLHVFHMRCLRRNLGISWQDKVTNNEVVLMVGIASMYILLCKRCLCWLGHVHRITIAAFQMIYCTDKSSWSRNVKNVHSCLSKMTVNETCKPWAWAQTTGRRTGYQDRYGNKCVQSPT